MFKKIIAWLKETACHHDRTTTYINHTDDKYYPYVFVTTECKYCGIILTKQDLADKPIEFIDETYKQNLISIKEYDWACRNERVRKMQARTGMGEGYFLRN